MVRSPPIAMSGAHCEASRGWVMNGIEVATASGAASACRLAPARPLASHQPISSNSPIPKISAGIVSRMPARVKSLKLTMA